MLNKAYEVPADEVTPIELPCSIIAGMDCSGSTLSQFNKDLPGVIQLLYTTRAFSHPESRILVRKEELGVPAVCVDFAREEELQGVYPGDYFRALRIIELEQQLQKTKDPIKQEIIKLQIRDWSNKIKSRLYPSLIYQVRADCCKKLIEKIKETAEKQGIPAQSPIFSAGVMSLYSEEFVDEFPIIANTHPGDLLKHDLRGFYRGARMIVGDAWRPSAKALSARHETLYTSIHQIILEMDAGPVFMRGYGLPIDYNYVESKIDLSKGAVLEELGGTAQGILKHIGDYLVAGAFFSDLLYAGCWGKHKSGDFAYFTDRWFRVPAGISIEDHVNNIQNTRFQRPKEFIEDKIKEFYDKVDEISKR